MSGTPVTEQAPALRTPRRKRPSSQDRTLWKRGEIEALLRVSKAVALNPTLSEVLDVVASEACRVTSAAAASVVFVQRRGPLRLAASIGLSRDYNRFLRNHIVTYTGTMSRVAVDRLAPVVVDDIASDPRFEAAGAADWKRFALAEGIGSMLSAPLVAGRRAAGALNLYRTVAGPWDSGEVDLAASLAQHAASAIDKTKLIASRSRQVDGLERIARVLRDQTHEYASRLHDVSGLLAAGELDAADRLLATLITLHHDDHATVVDRIHDPIVAGLLLAQMSLARQRGVELTLHGKSKLSELPPSLGSAEAVTILANLIDNAIESVATMPASRRRASVQIAEAKDEIRITVRDWGSGISSAHERRVFDRGRSSKDGHSGVGLALVREAVEAAHGQITITARRPGTAFVVAMPIE